MKNGFTLLEILTVLAVIAILSLISLPIYKQIQPTLNLDAQTKSLAGDLRYAQQLAVSEQKTYVVVFNLIGSSYQIINLNSGQIIKAQVINQTVHLESITGLTDNTAEFTVTGAAVESGIIVLTNNQNKEKTVEIKPSGYVKIQ